MNRPKDPCKVCPFARQCIAEGEDKRWCFIRILTLEAWDRADAARRKKIPEVLPPSDPNESRLSVGLFGPGGLDMCAGCNRKADYDRAGYCLDCARVKI